MDEQEILSITSNTIEEDAENLITPSHNSDFQMNQTFTVIPPKPTNKALIDVNTVNKIKKTCQKARKKNFSLAELLLGLSTLFLGAFFSALISQIAYEFKWLSIIFYSICPIIGVGCLVAYFLLKKEDSDNINSLVEKIEEYLEEINQEGDTSNEH